ncbi:helix-turn-helix domain-containing protein [Nesterenkonia massiliensis]|uniref:helix-turn-helix domain-containing protein n=1 Tax=Nesterenkonia massiliensis TaxID=1232429 RepID=UPI0011CCD9AF
MKKPHLSKQRDVGLFRRVLLNGLKPNLQHRFEHLEVVWDQARRGVYDGEATRKQSDFDVVTEPSRPPRTPPTPEEVDAIRTARTSGESVRSIAARFNKHRSTIWRYTKDI